VRSLYLDHLDARIRWIDLSGGGPAHVYVHGLGCAGSADFPHIAAHPRLAGHRAVIVDLLGHGYSDRPPHFCYSLQDHARTVAAVIDHCSLEDSVLIGHSMGGAIAIVLAVQRPELFSRVILAEPNLRSGAGAFSGPITAHTEDEFVAGGFDTVVAGFEPTYAARVRISDPTALHRSAVSLVEGTQPDLAQRFLGLPHERALIVGARNRPYPDEDLISDAGIPVIGVPGAGHDLMHENPEGFVHAVATATSGEPAATHQGTFADGSTQRTDLMAGGG